MDLVEVENLRVCYGRTVAVDDISFTIPEGDIFGFIGPNGAGKTSTMKVLATLLSPASGIVRIDGKQVDRDPYAIRRIIGFMPDNLGVYEDLTVLEYLHFFAAAYRIVGEQRHQVVADVLALTDLDGKKDAKVDSLSRGMKQRLGVARVLLHDPKFLLLDEPASGLDPRARIEIREILKELRNMGKTVLISSHILQELAHMCTRIGILEAGKMVATGSLDEIYRSLRITRTVHVRITNLTPEMLEQASRIPAVVSVRRQVDRVIIELREHEVAVEDLLTRLSELGCRIAMFQPEAMDMETVFMKLTEGKTA